MTDEPKKEPSSWLTESGVLGVLLQGSKQAGVVAAAGLTLLGLVYGGVVIRDGGSAAADRLCELFSSQSPALPQWPEVIQKNQTSP
jgi:hypothetical protein